MLITGSLLIIVVLAFLSVVFGNAFLGVDLDLSVDSGLIVNGTTSTLLVEGNTIAINLDPLTVGIVVITVLITIVSLLGINILGSGYNDSGVRILSILFGYSGVWAFFSTLAWNLVYGIELFGGLIWIGLTIIYGVGVLNKIAGGNQ